MEYKTEVTWGPQGTIDPTTAHQKKLFTEHLMAAIANKLTTNTNQVSNNPIIRTWATKEAAQEWVDLLNSFIPPPISAVVIGPV